MLLTLGSLAARGYLNLEEPVSNEVCQNDTLHYIPVSVRIVVGVTCVLSMIGALLIVLSYILIREIRTKAREILVNLSLMDFMSAAANFIGVVSSISRDLSSGSNDTIENNLCIAQASFAMYGTLSSVLWTICVAVYVFIRIMMENVKIAQRSVYAFYVICYGIPLIMTAWFASTGKLGMDKLGGSGWCSLRVTEGRHFVPFNTAFGNDIWIYLTMILVPLILISLHFYLRYQVKAGKTILTHNLTTAVQSVERKLMLIPIIFILLRVWSLLISILVVEIQVPLSCIAVLFFLHIAGIGDSGQGFANAVLFVLFTPKVRRYFLRLLLCRCCCRCPEPLLTHKVPQYGAVSTDYDSHGYSNATLSSTSAMNDQDTKSLLVNAS